jgi:hypothetical protein
LNPITIFRGTSGLNTVDDPARIPMAKNAISDVAELVNMRVDSSGRPSKRVGQTLIEPGSFHSMYCDGWDCFVAKDRDADTAIYQVGNDGTLAGVMSGLTIGQRIAFKKYGAKTYYANGMQYGIIEDGVSKTWEPGEYHGPATDRSFSIPSGITHLEVHSGRVFASAGNVLWWSELFRFDLFDQARSLIQFHTDIRMIKSVPGGLYVSTAHNTYFLTGNKPSDFTMVKAASFPALEWSDAIEYVEGGDIGFDPGLCALWVSPEGAILGFPSGQILNLTKNKIIYPENFRTGFGGLMGYNFIHGAVNNLTIDTNLKNKASSQYLYFDANSIVKFNHGYWAAGDNGIYSLGAVDVTNTAYLLTATMDFGINNDKRLRYVYLSLESTGNLSLIINTEKVSSKTYTVPISGAGQQDIRIPISRELYGRFWTFKISGTCDFSIDEIKILPIVRNLKV